MNLQNTHLKLIAGALAFVGALSIANRNVAQKEKENTVTRADESYKTSGKRQSRTIAVVQENKLESSKVERASQSNVEQLISLGGSDDSSSDKKREEIWREYLQDQNGAFNELVRYASKFPVEGHVGERLGVLLMVLNLPDKREAFKDLALREIKDQKLEPQPAAEEYKYSSDMIYALSLHSAYLKVNEDAESALAETLNLVSNQKSRVMQYGLVRQYLLAHVDQKEEVLNELKRRGIRISTDTSIPDLNATH